MSWKSEPFLIGGQVVGDPYAAIDGSISDPTTGITAPASGGNTPQFAGILSSYTYRPPWKVAGVDYYIGIDRLLYPSNSNLKDPTVSANLPAGASYSSGIVHIDGTNNITLDGFDFTLHSTSLYIGQTTATSGTTVSNCNFGGSVSQTNSPIFLYSHSSNTTIVKCYLDAQIADYSGTNGVLVNDGATGSLTILYCSFNNAYGHMIEFEGSTNCTPTIKYCTIVTWGAGAAAHGNPWYFEANTTVTNGLFSFIMITQDYSGAIGSNPALAMPIGETNTSCTNSTISYCTVPYPPTAPSDPPGITYIFGGAGTSGCAFTNNYFDPNAAEFLPFVGNDGFTNLASYSGNVDMTNGLLATPVVFTNGNPSVSATNNYTAGTKITILQRDDGSTLPSNIVNQNAYYVLAAGLSTSAFELSSTSGGSAITPSGSSSGTIMAMA